MDSFFEENNSCHQIANAYFESDIEIKKLVVVFILITLRETRMNLLDWLILPLVTYLV